MASENTVPGGLDFLKLKPTQLRLKLGLGGFFCKYYNVGKIEYCRLSIRTGKRQIGKDSSCNGIKHSSGVILLGYLSQGTGMDFYCNVGFNHISGVTLFATVLLCSVPVLTPRG